MKKIIQTILIISIPIIGYGQERSKFLGVGIGPLYNGMGINYEIPASNLFNYISVGCPGIGYGGDSGLITNCGVGYSIVITPIPDNKRYGFGVNIGAGISHGGSGSDPYYLAGLNYTYFYRGAEKRGWNGQIGPAIQYLRTYYSPIVLLGFGYQF